MCWAVKMCALAILACNYDFLRSILSMGFSDVFLFGATLNERFLLVKNKRKLVKVAYGIIARNICKNTTNISRKIKSLERNL